MLFTPNRTINRPARVLRPWELPWVTEFWDARQGVTSSAERVSSWVGLRGLYTLEAAGGARPILVPYSGTNYLWLPAVNGNYASTPDAAPLDITGDIDIHVFLAAADWTPSTALALVSKSVGGVAGTGSYVLYLNTDGTLHLFLDNGSATVDIASTVATGLTDNSSKWVRVAWVSGSDAKFYLSDDGATWTQLGATVSNAFAGIRNGNNALTIGNLSGGIGFAGAGGAKIYRARIYNGINGTLAFDANFASVSEGATSFTESSSNAATVTINRSGAKPAYIVGSQMLLGDGAAHFMQTGAITVDAPYSLIEVAADTGWTSGDVTLDGRTANSFAFQQITASPQIRLHDGGANGATVSPTLYTWYVRSGVQAADGTASLGLNLAARTSDTLSATGLGGVTAWADGSGANFAAGFKKALVLCNTALSTAQLTRTITTLNQYLGVF